MYQYMLHGMIMKDCGVTGVMDCRELSKSMGFSNVLNFHTNVNCINDNMVLNCPN